MITRCLVRLMLLTALQPALGQASIGTPVMSAPMVVTTQSLESAAAVIDEAGRAHVIILTRHPRSLEHLSIARDGNVEREVIEAHPPAGAPTTAFNGDGRLHVAIGGRAYAQSQGQWTQLTAAPPCETLMRAGADLACGFVIKSAAEGMHGHWSFGVLGGAQGRCLPFAWYSRNYKLVIARETAHGDWNWTVLDGKADRTVDHYALAGSRDGALYALYSTSGLSQVSTQSAPVLYTRLPIGPPSTPMEGPDGQAAKPGAGYADTFGQPLSDWLASETRGSGSGRPCIAVNWYTGDATLLVGGEAPYVSPNSDQATPAVNLLGLRCDWRRNIAVDAADRWHTIYVHDHRTSYWRSADYYDLCYRLRDHSGWSKPVGLGKVATESTTTSVMGSVAGLDPSGRTTLLASNSAGIALALWIQPDGQLIARWIDSTSPTLDDSANTHEPGADDTVSNHCKQAAFSSARSKDGDRLAHPSYVPITSEAAQQLLAPDEHAEQVLGHVVWYGEAKSGYAQAKELLNGLAPEGALVVSDKAIFFTSAVVKISDSGTPESSQTTLRIAYTNISEVQIENFMKIRSLRIHTKDGQDQFFAVQYADSTSLDREATQAAGNLLSSKIQALTHRY
jgi:hypothetical protein